MKTKASINVVFVVTILLTSAQITKCQTQGFYPSGVSGLNLTTKNTIGSQDPNWKNVGIGIDDPDLVRSLHIRREFGDLYNPEDPYHVYTVGIRLDYKVFSTGMEYSWDLANAFGDFNIYNVDNERIDFSILKGNGYTGIGTNSPQGRLDVNSGESGYTDALYVKGHPSISHQGGIMHHQGGVYMFQEIAQGTGYLNDATLRFHFTNRNNPGEIIKEDILVIRSNGKVGINNNSPQYELDVSGVVHSCEVIVDNINGWCDYVFDDNYKLPKISEVEEFIKNNHHLPDVPSAQVIESEGINLGDMDAVLLKKIEELTLYMIQLKKENDEQQKIIEVLLSE